MLQPRERLVRVAAVRGGAGGRVLVVDLDVFRPAREVLVLVEELGVPPALLQQVLEVRHLVRGRARLRAGARVRVRVRAGARVRIRLRAGARVRVTRCATQREEPTEASSALTKPPSECRGTGRPRRRQSELATSAIEASGSPCVLPLGESAAVKEASTSVLTSNCTALR